ncbi:MFS transporter [Nocardia terrae]|nr:MFS transporter [Nocardia terrae]
MRNTSDAATGRATEFRWTPGLLVALAALCLAQLLETVDITVVNVALPALRTRLGFSAATLHWVITAYTICFGGCLLLGGRIGDLVGYRRVFASGTAVFGLTSLACALAGNAGEFVAARGLQGAAAGFVSPMTLALLAAIFPEGRPRTIAVTVWGAATAVSGSLGFVAGGLLVDGPGWRWIFAINPVICGVVLAAVLRFVPAAAPTSPGGRFDVVGAVVSTCAAGLLVYGVTQIGEHSWRAPSAFVPLAAAMLLLTYFALHETRLAAHPLIPLRLFTIRTVVAANLTQLLISGAIYALFYLLSLELQQLLGSNALGTGSALVPFSVLLLVCAGAGPLVVRYLGFRGSIAAGGLIGATGMLALAHTVTADGPTHAVVLPSLIVAFGFALTFVPITVAAVTGVPPTDHGIASGLVNVTRTLGGAIGLAVIAAATTGRTNHLLNTGSSAHQALAGGFRLGFDLCAILLSLAALAAILLLHSEGRGHIQTPNPFPENTNP